MHDYTTRQINTPEGWWVPWTVESGEPGDRRGGLEDTETHTGGITQPL